MVQANVSTQGGPFCEDMCWGEGEPTWSHPVAADPTSFLSIFLPLFLASLFLLHFDLLLPALYLLPPLPSIPSYWLLWVLWGW